MTVPERPSAAKLGASATALALTLVVSGCGRPTFEEVVDKSSAAVCEKGAECLGDRFTQSYPGGVPECTQKIGAALKEQRKDDLEKSSACTDSEVDECLSKFKASACPAGGTLPSAPCNC